MNNPKITFIGVGHMATAMINGMIKQHFPAENITATNKSLAKLKHLPPNINKSTDNDAAIANADVIILAVKPQVLLSVIETLHIKNQPLIISIAASISLTALANGLGKQRPIVRCMPNMPAVINQAATGAIANQQVSDAQLTLAETILNAIGITVWLESEKQLAIVTAIAGSAPAYYFFMLETLQAFAEQQGLSAEQAKLLAAQTCAGSGALALHSSSSFTELKQQIMSPGGITEAAIGSMQEQNFNGLMQKALTAAIERSENIAKS